MPRAGQQAVVRSERDDRPPDARRVHAADAGPAQAVHRQGAARDLSAGLGVQVRHRARRARGRPGRRGRVDVLHRRVPAVADALPLPRHARARSICSRRSSTRATSTSGSSRSAIGLDRIAEVAREFGLGAPTNLGINGDAGGRHPDEGLVREATAATRSASRPTRRSGRATSRSPCCRWRWRTRRSPTAATLYVPQVVERVESYDGRTIVAYEPKVARTVKVPAGCARDLEDAACGRSTTRRAAPRSITATVEVVPVMGKTGTAEVKKHHKDSEDEELDVAGNPNALARVVRGLGAGRGSRARDRRARRARRLRRPRRVADRASASSRATSAEIRSRASRQRPRRAGAASSKAAEP